MERIIIGFLIISFISCSPKLRSSIITRLPELPKTELVVVLDVFDGQIIKGEKIGDLKATDNGFSFNCSYYENLQYLKNLARKSGGNLIKIIKLKQPGKWSSCYRIWVNVYKVENPRQYETEVEWSLDRKLTWEDFKGKPNNKDFPRALAVTNSVIDFNPSNFGLFSKGKFIVRAKFINNGSWVTQIGKTDYVLRHEQIHFDITEIYARKLRMAFSESNITIFGQAEVARIFNRIKEEWQIRQEFYDTQTLLGSKKETQEEWEAIVKIELAKYDLYKEN